MKSLSTRIQERLKINKNYINPMSRFEKSNFLIMLQIYDGKQGTMTVHILNNINIKYADNDIYIVSADESKITEKRRSYISLKLNKEKFTATGNILYKSKECGEPVSGKIFNILLLPEYVNDIDKTFSGLHLMSYVTFNNIIDKFNIELNKIPDDFISTNKKYEIHTMNKVFTQIKNYLLEKQKSNETV